ncbi:hypothetical protein FRC02_003758 [Tulasnella sp. 418]|nr:hypothetical protein FRC02_003758 [Tulasnella sp. 418]
MAPVKLFVYDLSNGMAKSLSFQLTGKQIDGIWHTSVVVFGKEVYFGPYNAGPGIQITAPGKSHHGRPLKIEDMGETMLDEETFMEYINEVQEIYTGEKYHLLDFNCNSFTNDCVGFLTGGSIPNWIKDLPSDFLSTPFGASLRPTIDNMFRRPVTPAVGAPAPAPVTTPLASASTAATLTSPVQFSTNLSSFHSILSSHKAVVAFFTSDTCAPCRMISPVFRQLAEEKAGDSIAFVEVNGSVGFSASISQEFRISATPTFLFFLNGTKTNELKGVNAPELRTQVELLLFDAFPPHPHTKLDLPGIRSISLQPILYNQSLNIDAALKKLISFVDAVPVTSLQDKGNLKSTLSEMVSPFLKRINGSAKGKEAASHLQPNLLPLWSSLTNSLLLVLPAAELFPLVDMWRVAVLDDRVATWLSSATSRNDGSDITRSIFTKVQNLQQNSGAGEVPRNLLLTSLKLATNCFAHGLLARHVLTPSLVDGFSPRQTITSILIPSLLHQDAVTRTAAASLAFNVAASIQKPLLEDQRSKKPNTLAVPDDDGDWIVELVSAISEALAKEETNEDTVHRLTASLAFLVHLSPFYSETIHPLLQVLQVKDTLLSKLVPGGCGEKGIVKKEARIVIEETSSLC